MQHTSRSPRGLPALLGWGSTGRAALLPRFALIPIASDAEPPGLGTSPDPALLRARDLDVTPDGAGLPAGKGSVAGGRRLYAKLCASCHEPGGEGGPIDRLAGGQGSLATGRPVKTIGSFRPYATTLFEYVRRAMPFNPPQSLAADEVYALTGKPALTGINAGRLRAGTIALSDCRGGTMHRLLKRALGGALLLSAFAGAAWAQDKFANCPDPEAARKHVKECLAANPYNTQEVCEERALEKLCRKK